MTSNAKPGVQTGVENWMLELLLPGVFTLILAICLGHLAYCALQAQHVAVGVDYAISAFAN